MRLRRMSVIQTFESDAGVRSRVTSGYAACEIITIGKLRAEHTVRKQILCPKLFQRLVDDRQFVMAVEIAFAEAGEMLATSQHVRASQAGEKLASIVAGRADSPKPLANSSRCARLQMPDRGRERSRR